MMQTFWTGKRIVITGGAGLVGSALAHILSDEGADVLVLDDSSRGQNRVDSQRIHYVKADAGVKETCRTWFKAADAVFNLAAHVAGVVYNQKHHSEMFLKNMRVLTAPVIVADELQVPLFLQTSSVCVYATDKMNPCREETIGGDPHESNAGYAWAKRMGERVAQWSGLPHCVIVRPANIYGVRDYFDERAHVIPALIKKILNDDVIRVHGTGQEVREFLYVTDAARGMMTALEKGAPNQVYNIGTDGTNSCTISELAYTLRDMLGVDKSIEFDGGDGGDLRRIVNGDKLMTLGWKATMPLNMGLETLCDWYKLQMERACCNGGKCGDCQCGK